MHPSHQPARPLAPTDGLLAEAVAAVRAESSLEPEVAIILGSGLGPLADEIEAEAVLGYEAVPGLMPPRAPGHAGRLHLGRLSGRRVLALRGRAHLYDGASPQQLAFPVRLARLLGARALLVSNACGGLHADWSPGDLMLQVDFINFTGANPLTGENDDRLGPRFPVMFDCYDPRYQELVRSAARRLGLSLREGVYLAMAGPSYATRAELRAFRALGADAVGMSTVHEVIAARHAGLRVLGLSCVTDLALPESREHATGEEVVAAAERAGGAFRRLVRAVVAEL